MKYATYAFPEHIQALRNHPTASITHSLGITSGELNSFYKMTQNELTQVPATLRERAQKISGEAVAANIYGAGHSSTHDMIISKARDCFSLVGNHALIATFATLGHALTVEGREATLLFCENYHPGSYGQGTQEKVRKKPFLEVRNEKSFLAKAQEYFRKVHIQADKPKRLFMLYSIEPSGPVLTA